MKLTYRLLFLHCHSHVETFVSFAIHLNILLMLRRLPVNRSLALTQPLATQSTHSQVQPRSHRMVELTFIVDMALLDSTLHFNLHLLRELLETCLLYTSDAADERIV